MKQLVNIQVFAVSVAQIMEQLDSAFPLPSQVSTSHLDEIFGPTAKEIEPRVINPGEPDYEALLPYGFVVECDLVYVSSEQYSESVGARHGEPIGYWTEDQRKAISARRLQVREASKIFDATLEFLLREGYAVEVGQATQPYLREYVLTSKGFAHLNKKFEGGTIREEFQHRTLDRVFQLVKGGGDVAIAGTALVNALSIFLK